MHERSNKPWGTETWIPWMGKCKSTFKLLHIKHWVVLIIQYNCNVRESANKNKYFLNGLTPPPKLNGSRNFIFSSFFCLKIAENGFYNFFRPHNYWTKRAILFAKKCNKPVKRLRLCQHCQYWYFDMSSKVNYLLFSNRNKIKKSFKKNIYFFINCPAFSPPLPPLNGLAIKKRTFFLRLP